MLLALLFVTTARAAPKPAEVCALPATVDQRLRVAQAVFGGFDQKGAYTTAVTKLLAQTYASVLDPLSERIQKLTREQVLEALPKIDKLYERHWIGAFENESNFEEAFEDAYRLYNFRGRLLGVTPYNSLAMRRLIRATLLVDRLSVGEPMDGCSHLLYEHSYTTVNVREGVRMGNLSLLQAVSQLSATPVENLPADALVREILSCGPDCDASPMVRYSLALKPRVLGFYGSYFYPRVGLVRSAGRLEFSESLKASFRKDNEDFALRGHKNFELGHGCPVGFSVDQVKRSSLQRYADAIVHVYDLIP